MHISYSFEGGTELEKQLALLIDPPLEPLGTEWQRILVEDNRMGALSGQDGDGMPYVQTIYRTSTVQAAAPRGGADFGVQASPPKRGGRANLKSKMYRRLAGPPLAPRGPESRVVSNLETQAVYGPTGVTVEAGWNDFVSRRGFQILTAHFAGNPSRNLPVRDPRGLRPWGRAAVEEALERWLAWVLDGAEGKA